MELSIPVGDGVCVFVCVQVCVRSHCITLRNWNYALQLETISVCVCVCVCVCTHAYVLCACVREAWFVHGVSVVVVAHASEPRSAGTHLVRHRNW